MNQWHHIMTRQEIDAFHAMTERLDPAFASRERRWFESRTKAQLETEAHQAWHANNPTAYQLARSYAALRD